MNDTKTVKPRWLFRTLRAVEFIAVLAGIIAIGVELYDRQQERAVRKAQMLIDLTVLRIEHGEPASPAIRSSLEVLIQQRVRLRGLDFSDLDLRGASLPRANCPYCNFSRILGGSADLSRSELSFASLENAYMPEANLSDAVLIGANLGNARFERGTLAGANLSHASLRGATFDGTDMSGVNFTEANVSGALLQGTNLTQAQLDQACVDPEGSPRSMPNDLRAPEKECDYI